MNIVQISFYLLLPNLKNKCSGPSSKVLSDLLSNQGRFKVYSRI